MIIRNPNFPAGTCITPQSCNDNKYDNYHPLGFAYKFNDITYKLYYDTYLDLQHVTASKEITPTDDGALTCPNPAALPPPCNGIGDYDGVRPINDNGVSYTINNVDYNIFYNQSAYNLFLCAGRQYSTPTNGGTITCPNSFLSNVPTIVPTISPSNELSVVPSVEPSIIPSDEPSVVPSVEPSIIPSDEPSYTPSGAPIIPACFCNRYNSATGLGWIVCWNNTKSNEYFGTYFSNDPKFSYIQIFLVHPQYQLVVIHMIMLKILLVLGWH